MKTQTQPVLIALAMFAMGCAIAIYEKVHLASVQQAEKTERFASLADRATRQLNQRMQVYEYGLRGTRGAVLTAGSDGITRDKFRIYSASRELEREFPGSRGFGFIRRVAPDEENRFLRAARADGKPDFRIRQLSPQAGERLVIQYIEPEAHNREAVGLDIASESHRHQAAIAAINSGKPTLTQPITLVQASGKKQQGFLFLLPIYHPEVPAETPQQRRHANFGLAYTPLLIDEVLADFDLLKDAFSLVLYDVSSAPEPEPFFASAGASEPARDELAKRIRLPLYGREWMVEVKARPAFIASLNHRDVNTLAVEIVGASALLAVMVFLVLHNALRRRQSALDHAKLAAIVESSTDAIIGKDLKGVVSSWNRAAENIFGYSAAEALGRRLRDLVVPPELAQEEVEILTCIAQGQTIPHRTAVRRRKDGELIDVSITVSPIRDANDRVVGASKTVRDVTEENRKERRFRLAIDAAGVGVWVWHLQSNQLTWDQRMFDMYGAPDSLHASGLYYDFWKAHVHPDDLAHAEEKLQQHIDGKGIYDPVFRIVRDDGEIRWLQASATIECDYRGKPLQMVGTNLDITEQRLAQARILELNANLETQVEQRTTELQQALAVVQRATEAKSEFLSNMSHEIRTPMNAVLGFAYLLQKEDLPGESRRMVEKIHGAGHALLGIINDILDFSKIEAKRLEIENVPFRLSDVLDNVANIMASTLGDKQVETIVTPSPSGADFLKGDALRLGQVLINLVSNAIKFTHQGEIVLSVTRLDSGTAGEVRLRFGVRDTGIGIAKDKQAAIFKAFSQADTSTTRSYGGTGLGLTISSRLVELMGGALQVRSELGKGSEFSFEITFGLSDPTTHAMPKMAHQRVLVADDQPSARAVLAETVSSLGWHADTVVNGEEAVEHAGLAGEQPYDILLLDWRMPQVDGLQAAQKIRETWGHASPPIIVMVTAFDREQLQDQPGSDTVDVILTKPVTGSSLYNAVQLVKNRRGTLEIPKVTPASTQRLTGLRALVVDDSEINREVAASILQGEGAVVDLAEDGSVALQVLTSRPDDFDVVLMDMQMPVMDGYAATRQLRAVPRLAQLPVIALTAGAFATQRYLALASGVNAFVAKPFDVNELIQAILELTAPAKGQAAQLSADLLLPAMPEKQGGGAPAMAPIMNTERARMVWKDATAYAQILRKFAQSHAQTVRMMGDAKPEDACKLAHKLRGAAAQLWLERVSALAALTEERLKAGQDASQPMGQLQAAMTATIATIDALAPAAPAAPMRSASVPMNPQVLAPHFSRLMQALDADDIRAVESLMADLIGKLPEEQLAPLRTAVSNYDFRSAELVLGDLARQCDIF